MKPPPDEPPQSGGSRSGGAGGGPVSGDAPAQSAASRCGGAGGAAVRGDAPAQGAGARSGGAGGGPASGDGHADPAELAPLDDRHRAHQLRQSIVSLAILGVLIVGLLFAIPGLRGVERQLRHAAVGWLVAGVGLELLSCVGYVLTFELVFTRAPRRFATRLAWSEMAFQAAVSVGGAGGVALGAWVLRQVGVPTNRIAERSAVLFLATSAVNVVVLVFFGVGLAVGVFDGPANPLLSVVPAAVGVVVLAYQIGYLANIVPVPGGIGPLDGGLVGMLVAYGVRATPATAAVLSYHAIALWVPTIVGTVAFALLRRQIKALAAARAGR